MQGSLERVRAVINGDLPDRPPLYELLRNDAVINHFTGRTLTVENAPQVVFQAYQPAVDATRPLVRLPEHERTVTLADGRQRRYFRWTIWTAHRRYPDGAAYVAAKQAELDAFDPAWGDNEQASVDQYLADVADHRRRLGEVFFFPGCRSVGLTGLYDEVGLEQFAYYMADCPEIIDQLLEQRTVRAITWLEHLPDDHGLEAIFSAEDIAYKGGPLFSPRWLRRYYFPRLARLIDAYHAQGIKVLFHSDGNLNLIMDDLLAAGIDGLNPLETLSGMDVVDIHSRYPQLFLAGGIDVSQLLPHGSPAQVKEAVCRALEGAEGRLMVGSTTELHNDVPLENYLALREAVLDYRY